MQTVNLLQFYPWTFIMHLIRAFITFNIAHSLLKDKYNIFVTFFSIVIPTIVFSYASMSFTTRKNEMFMVLIYYAIVFIILLITSQGTILQKLSASLFSYLAYLAGSLLFSVTIGSIMGDGFLNGIKYEIPLVYFLSNVLFVFSFSFVFIAFIKFFQIKKNKNQQTSFKYIFFMLFPVTHILGVMQESCAFINIYTSNKNHTMLTKDNFEFYSIFFTVLCLLIDFSLFFIINHFEKLETSNVENQKIIMKNTIDYNKIQLHKQEEQEFRKLRHDYINTTNTAKGLIEIGKPEKALQILSGINNSLLDLSGLNICTNETVNTIFYLKKKEASESNIKLSVSVTEDYPIKINDYDLCRILNNLIDNAINAVKPLENNKNINFEIEITDETISIIGQNHYAETKRSKEYMLNHGNGTKIIKEIVSKYNGKYQAFQNENIWHTETTLSNSADSTTPPPAKFNLFLKFFNQKNQEQKCS